MENTDKKTTPKTFFTDVLKGGLIGVALITPGFSGGTVAMVLGIYYGLVSAIAGLFKNFKKNFLYLLPFALGMIAAVAALIIPMRLAFDYIPLPIICLFVGLMLGGVPPIAKEAGKPSLPHILSFALACAFAVGICFIPVPEGIAAGGEAGAGVYFALAGVGVVAACGFVVPGISGSMIMMIFGLYYYVLGAGESLLRFENVCESLLILFVFLIGVVIGFFLISLLMKFFLTRYKRGTYYAILGFMAGSVFSIYYKQETLITDVMPLPAFVVLSAVLFAVGFAASFVFCKLTEKSREIEERADDGESDGSGNDDAENNVKTDESVEKK